MANDTYTVDVLATGGATILLTDDGSGSDWLAFLGTYTTATDIRLGYTSSFGVSTSASGFYFNPGNIGHRLIVNGVIENVRGSNGADFIQGNEVSNWLYGDNTAGGVGGNDTITGFEGNDSIVAGSGDDVANGDEGNDSLSGGLGTDTLNGGSGRDTVQGGRGADVLFGGSDLDDMVSYTASNAGVTVSLTFGSATTGAGGDAQGDSIFGFTDVTGSQFDDVITDNDKGLISFSYNANSFFGGAGNDRLYLGGGLDDGHGGAGNDLLYGEAGNDALLGDAGDDSLRGGTGADRLTGGLGADQFIFYAKGETTVGALGRDSILDFHATDGDKINLRAMDADITLIGNQNFTYIDTAAFDGRKGLVRVESAGTGGVHLLVTGDVDGNKTADFAILVWNTTGLTGGDFVL